MQSKYVIPLEFIKLDTDSFHLLVKAKINRIPVNLVIDTGASRTVFDIKSFENSVKFSDEKSLAIQSAGIMADKIESRAATAEIFKIGKLRLNNHPLILIDLESINDLYQRVTGKKIHGLLGSDFLMKMKSTINYQKMVLILRKPEDI
jgi:hypothetical protein